MSIIFLLNHLCYGGVAIVTLNLANRFVSDGHNVCVFAFSSDGHTLKDQLDSRVKFVTGCGWGFCAGNVEMLRQVIKDFHTNLVVNQWGLPFKTILTARLAGRGLGAKYWSFYHNDPSANGRIQSVENEIKDCRSTVVRWFLTIKHWIAKFVTSRSMRLSYRLSDKYCILSESFVPVFSDFTGLYNPDKLEVLTNPITVDGNDYKYSQNSKCREIMYCGRLEYNPKRVDRIIDAWAALEAKYIDWKLTIVGDGPDRNHLEACVKKMGLSRVTFAGFQPPAEYYKKASILLLTSDFEGFGLVIVEAMQFGVIPIVYGSYVAVFDIIDDGINGFITSAPYNTDDTVDRLRRLMDDEKLREQMATAAIKKAKSFSMNAIAKKWYSLMDDISRP